MAEYFLEANIDDQQTHLMNLLFADDQPAHHRPAIAQLPQAASHYPEHPHHHHHHAVQQPLAAGLMHSFRHDTRLLDGHVPGTHVHPMYYAAAEAAVPVANGFPSQSAPIVARHYISTAAGGHFVEETLLPKLPDRVARNCGHRPSYHSLRAGGQSQFGGGSGGRAADAAYAIEQLELEPIPAKPLLLRERIIDKLADVCKVLSTLSAQKCDASTDPAHSMTAHRYAAPAAAAPLPQCWAHLQEALATEYRQVLAVTLALERECAARGGMPGDLQPTRALNELAAAVDGWQMAGEARVFTADQGAIGEEMENEVNGLLELLDQLFLSIRMACTNLWLMRTVLLCARDRPAAPQTPPQAPAQQQARLRRIRRSGS